MTAAAAAPACAGAAIDPLQPTPLAEATGEICEVGVAGGGAPSVSSALHCGSIQVVLSREAPHALVWASHAWRQLYLGQEQPVGAASFSIFGQQLLQLLQGPLTAPGTADALADALRSDATTMLRMISYTRAGRPFSHLVRVEPMTDTNGAVQCFQLTSSDVHFVDTAQGAGAAMRAAGLPLPGGGGSGGGGAIPSDLAINEMLAWLA